MTPNLQLERVVIRKFPLKPIDAKGRRIQLYTSPDHALGAEITLVLSSRNHKAKTTCDPYAVGVLTADTKSTGRYFPVMARLALDNIPPGPSWST